MNLLADFLPPLENGDKLSREEFEQRYQAMPAFKKAELQRGTESAAHAEFVKLLSTCRN